jgi:TolA-binding protein
LTVDEDSKSLGADFLDILGYNIYIGITDWRDGAYDSDAAKRMVDDLVSISRKHGKPILITETGYSTYWKSELQENVIRDQIAKVGKNLAGIIVFQWADDWSKAGDASVQNDHVEEHWGILEGARKPKGGYYAAKQMFRNTIFGNIMFGISDYFRGTYFAAKARVLRKKWKEDIIVDIEIEKLQNELNLKPSGEEAPAILEKLSRKFFEKKGYGQFASFLEDFRSSYSDSKYIGIVDYYIALAGWTNLEYLADSGLWEFYYAEKTRGLDEILNRLKLVEERTRGTDTYLKVLYLEWLIHNDLLSGNENVALERLEEAIKSYSESIRDAGLLFVYSKQLKAECEIQLSDKLLREYTSNVLKYMDTERKASLLKRKAESSLGSGDFGHAKILYDAYLDVMVRDYSEEDASFAIMELANLYRRRSFFDESIEVCERLVKEFPNSELADDAAYTIGVSLKEKKSYSRAIKAFRDFILDYPESDLSKSAIKETISIFTVYGTGTRAEKTVSFLKEIVALYPDTDFSIMARFELASSLAILDRREEAIREYQYIIDNHPDSEYAIYSKGSIERLSQTE